MGNKFFNNINNQDDMGNTNNSFGNNDNFKDLETNKKNSEEFDRVMDNASKKYDSYLDRNNIFVRLVLFCLFAFIVLGCLYYAILWFTNN
ncbi:unknown [Mycoplasma sp. CAG:877]|jgi:hypothetical protein|nr:unknown [Mycoplasma sp. CAG:877]